MKRRKVMYQIVVCDDEPAELEKTEKLLGEYEKEHPGLDLMIRCFEDVNELLCLAKEENYMPDLVIMDIYMPYNTRDSYPLGLKAAKELRSINYKGKIVFLTISREHALEAFDVDAMQYLVKPVSKDKFFVLLDNLLKDIDEERKKCILLKIEGRVVKVPLNDIVYCEAQRKMQCLYLVNGSRYIVRMTMAEIYEMLSHYKEFVRIGVAFIVNLGYIKSMNAKEIILDNGMKIYLPRGAYKGIKEQYFNYYCGEKM